MVTELPARYCAITFFPNILSRFLRPGVTQDKICTTYKPDTMNQSTSKYLGDELKITSHTTSTSHLSSRTNLKNVLRTNLQPSRSCDDLIQQGKDYLRAFGPQTMEQLPSYKRLQQVFTNKHHFSTFTTRVMLNYANMDNYLARIDTILEDEFERRFTQHQNSLYCSLKKKLKGSCKLCNSIDVKYQVNLQSKEFLPKCVFEFTNLLKSGSNQDYVVKII